MIRVVLGSVSSPLQATLDLATLNSEIRIVRRCAVFVRAIGPEQHEHADIYAMQAYRLAAIVEALSRNGAANRAHRTRLILPSEIRDRALAILESHPGCQAPSRRHVTFMHEVCTRLHERGRSCAFAWFCHRTEHPFHRARTSRSAGPARAIACYRHNRTTYRLCR
eukprot:4304180-Pleurochrysis_carterae.AAC.1